MPPVFGPSSPSRSRLCPGWRQRQQCWPSLMTMKLASSPSRKSSITTRAPASPMRLSTSIASMAACASASVCATTTPCGRQPVGLDDDRRAAAVRVVVRSRGVAEGLVLGGGMPCRFMKRLAKSFELSSWRRPASAEDAQAAGAEQVDDAGCQRRLRATTVSATSLATANSASAATSVISTFLIRALGRWCRAPCHRFRGRPAPGDRGERDSRHASACSRPPPPITRTFIARAPPWCRRTARRPGHPARRAASACASRRRRSGASPRWTSW